ncbi:MAG: pyridoxamine 5'-phosphate oxidase family protein [Actinomycetota bacterium]|nr:pyridoxamine 5'-phosphate oxidase family protein [Actinomycetota bacterium]
MTVVDGRTWLEMIQPDACWLLIGSEPIGRVAILVDGLPEIYPVNHLVDQRTILFRTDPGSKLRGLANSPMTCFEIDGVDADHRLGWSVMVKGRAIQLDTASAMDRVKDLPLNPWAQGEKSHWIRIEPVEVTGRRIRPHKERRP